MKVLIQIICFTVLASSCGPRLKGRYIPSGQPETVPTDRSTDTSGTATSGTTTSGTTTSGTTTSGTTTSGTTTSVTQSAPPSGPAFYISPSGNDTNTGTSSSAPFLTLTKAQKAMIQSSSVKTTYLMNGTYSITARLKLGSSDSGESWLAYPGQTPILDGGGTTDMAFDIRSSDNITIRFLTIQNFTTDGINAIGTHNIVIDSNTFENITSNDWDMGAIKFSGTFANGKITHNLIKNTGYCGISGNFGSRDDFSGLLIDRNAIYDTMKSVADGGAIYVYDPGHSGAPVTITNNIIGNYGNSSNGSKAIYLDDMLSNVTVENNIVYGTGQWAVQYHGGDHNTMKNNIFDISDAGNLGLYQTCNYQEDNVMDGNLFQCNIVYSSTGKNSSSLWDNLTNSSITPLNFNGNFYWGLNGTGFGSGNIIDSKAVVVNPNFVDSSKANYTFKSGSPAPCFKVIDVGSIGPLPNN